MYIVYSNLLLRGLNTELKREWGRRVGVSTRGSGTGGWDTTVGVGELFIPTHK